MPLFSCFIPVKLFIKQLGEVASDSVPFFLMPRFLVVVVPAGVDAGADCTSSFVVVDIVFVMRQRFRCPQ